MNQSENGEERTDVYMKAYDVPCVVGLIVSKDGCPQFLPSLYMRTVLHIKR